MIAWTTPNVIIHVPLDISAADVVVSVRQSRPYTSATSVLIEDASPTVTYADGVTTVEATFTQQQTSQLAKGDAEVQCNWILPDGTRGAIVAVRVRVNHNLHEEVMTYGV